MICPGCGATTATLETRKVEHRGRAYTRRRRECKTCEKRFTTAEVIVDDGEMDIVILKARQVELALRSVAVLLDPVTAGRASEFANDAIESAQDGTDASGSIGELLVGVGAPRR